MRIRVSLALVLLPTLAASASARAYSPDEKTPDAQSIAALEAKVEQAPAKDQCYLYAELVHQMTELSLHEYAAGNTDKAADMLKQVQNFARKLHLSVGEDNKRLKNAEILLRHTAFRLSEMLHSSSYEDRPLVEQTLAQVIGQEDHAALLSFAGSLTVAASGRNASSQSAALLACDAARTIARLSSCSTSSHEPM